MNILLLTSDAHGCNGGIAQYNRDLVDALADLPSTRQVTVVARNLHTAVTGLPDKAAFIEEATHGMGAFLRAAVGQAWTRHDLVICGHINLLPVAALLAMRSACPLVLVVYGIEVWKAPTSRLTRWLAQRVDAVWSISDYTRRRASDWLRAPAASWVLLPNAIRLERYGEATVPPGLAKRMRGQASHMILTLGRLASSERYKGIDEMLDVLPRLLESHPQLVYVIAGDGDDRPRLEARARALGIDSNVRFAGFVREDEKADLYRLADVFAMPGRGEGFGFVFLEALACGTPVVASSLDGSFEAVRGGAIGHAIDPGDPKALRAALLTALTQPRGIPDGLTFFAYAAFRDRLAAAMERLPSVQSGSREDTQ